MAETDTAIIGRHACGCITFANARPDDLHRDDEREIARFIREGGEVIRTTVGEARAMPHFLVSECPHDPKGWEPEPYEDPAEKITVKKPRWSDVYIVKKGYSRLGEVRKRAGTWEATKGWFNRRGDGADNGGEPRTPVEVHGPFKTRKAAVEALA